MPFADSSSAKSWRREDVPPRRILRTGAGLKIIVHRIDGESKAGSLSGAKLLFITDLHIRTDATWSFDPFGGSFMKWYGVDWLQRSLREAMEISKPDFLVFGGDLVVHSCWLERAMHMMSGLASGIPKVAVYGNWDKRRRRWLPHSVWSELYRQAGWRILVNEPFRAGPIRFFGLDDFKMGFPHYSPPRGDGQGLFNCVVSHNPDAVIRSISDADLAGIDLILCGHTHGGQWRIPALGAFVTSSRHWKCFELGLYRHKAGRARMLVSSGIGATAFRSRMNCPPELVLLEFA